MFEAVEFVDVRPAPDNPNPSPIERLLGTFDSEEDAIGEGRRAKAAFHANEDLTDYRWWIVREPGAKIAQWIADSHNDKEFVLDLTSGQLVEV